ncbi:DUF4935 domain-containing protein [Amphritea atlantica]|uniref:DUF4935 domain-containing protein n=1 Tax=Amphritea atlantica TaxID=355243 RepID=A0ABY5GTS4_9GAMM|nr:DUF4935 domain-containing protein [Amphritea atlantica]
MKNQFKAFYNLDIDTLKKAWKDEQVIFVFDANVLLNLYGYAEQTRDDFFKILRALEGKVWIPYQVGLEYQRRRLEVIKNEKSVFNDIESNLEKIQNVFNGDFERLALKRRFPKLFENTEKLEKEIYRSISNYKKSVAHWNSEQPCVRSHDKIRDQINSCFENRIGNKPEDQNWLDELFKEGSERYAKKIPPGYKDAGKSESGDETHFFFDGLNYERQYGDLILWKQILHKSSEENIKIVVFITDDSKEDWWYRLNSNGKKIIGPLAELQAEIYRESNIDCFHMYSTSAFMEDGKTNLSIEVKESSIEDASVNHIRERRVIDNEKLKEIIERSNLSNISAGRHKEILESLNNSMRHKELLESIDFSERPTRDYEDLMRRIKSRKRDVKHYKELQSIIDMNRIDPDFRVLNQFRKRSKGNEQDDVFNKDDDSLRHDDSDED